MTRGQETLIIDMYVTPPPARGSLASEASRGPSRYVVHRIVPDDGEIAAHVAYLEALARESKSGCLWLARESAIAVA